MEFYDIVRKRRSCRVFRPDPVPRETLERMVEAALWAPSGKNRQNWRIFMVTGEKKEELAGVAEHSFPFIEESLRDLYSEKVVSFTRTFFKTLGGAPVVAVFCSSSTPDGEFVDIQAVAAAVENFLLAAAHEGLGACWMTGPVHLREEVNDILGVEGLELVAMIPVGYEAKEPPVPPRKEGLVKWLGF